jgi:5-methylcytosine-specific restriction endonuclease McrA
MTVDPDVWWEVYQRDTGQCQVCGTSHDVQAHHVQYRSHLGDDSADNLTLLCARCHRLVHSDRIRVFRADGHTFWEPKHA